MDLVELQNKCTVVQEKVSLLDQERNKLKENYATLEQAYQADKANWDSMKKQQLSPKKKADSPNENQTLKKRKRNFEEKSITPQKAKPVILFSNFKDNTEYDLSRKEKLETITRKLGGHIVNNIEDPTVTHVICPPQSRTYKTLAAHILCLWVLSAEWLEESEKENDFLPEKDFGKRNMDNPLKGKNFYVTPQFRSEPKNTEKINYLEKLVVQLGKGGIVDNNKSAQYSLVIVDDNEDYSPSKSIQWNTLLNLIIPGGESDIGKLTLKKRKSMTEDDSPETERPKSPQIKERVSTNPKKKTRKSKKKINK